MMVRVRLKNAIILVTDGSRRLNHAASAKAFTLIEVVAVMVVLGMIATATVYSMTPHLRMVQINSAIEQVQSFDRKIRQLAIKDDSAIGVSLSTDGGRFMSTTDSRLLSVKIEGPLKISEIRVGTTTRQQGTLSFSVNANGRSPSYAIAFKTGEKNIWCVVTGLTGQTVRTTNRGEVDAILFP